VLEWIEGDSLQNKLNSILLCDRPYIFKQILCSVQYLNDFCGVSHAAFYLDNIMIGADQQQQQPKVILLNFKETAYLSKKQYPSTDSASVDKIQCGVILFVMYSKNSCPAYIWKKAHNLAHKLCNTLKNVDLQKVLDSEPFFTESEESIFYPPPHFVGYPGFDGKILHIILRQFVASEKYTGVLQAMLACKYFFVTICKLLSGSAVIDLPASFDNKYEYDHRAPADKTRLLLNEFEQWIYTVKDMDIPFTTYILSLYSEGDIEFERSLVVSWINSLIENFNKVQHAFEEFPGRNIAKDILHWNLCWHLLYL